MTERSARLSARLHGACVGLLPQPLRSLYGPAIRAEFEELIGERCASGGWRAVTRDTVGCCLDVLVVGIKERLRRGPVGSIRRRLDSTREGTMNWMREMLLAGRSLLRRPGFTAIAVVTLALGIGANVAIFTVVNAIMLRPLPYPESDRLVEVMHHAPGIGIDELNNSPGTVSFYRQFADHFSGFAAYDRPMFNLTGGEEPARVPVVRATPNLFDVLRAPPVLGRQFNEDDALAGAAPVAILAYDTWASRFGSDPGIVGQTIYLNGDATEVVGVMPRGFAFPSAETVLFTPLEIPEDPAFGEFGMNGIARLGPGITLDAATQRTRDLQSRVSEYDAEITDDVLAGFQWDVSVVPLRERVVGDLRATLWIVLGTVGFLLLIACLNVANLFLVRAEGRQREMAVRAAMGAGRSRVARAFLSESLLIGLGGGLLGVVLAEVGVRGLVAATADRLPRVDEIAVDATSLSLAFGLSLAVGAILGLLPMIRVLGRNTAQTLRDGGRSATSGRGRHRVRNLLVAAQLSLAVVLLVGSGLMLRSFGNLRTVDPGFEADGVLTMGLSLGRVEGVEAQTAAVQFYTDLLTQTRALPGVETAAVGNFLPLESGNMNGSNFDIESQPEEEGALPKVSMFVGISPDYFETLGVEILDGTAPTWTDVGSEAPRVWVSEEFVRQFLDGPALGERIRFGSEEQWAEIAGVVEDVRVTGLTDDLLPLTFIPLQVGRWAIPDMTHGFLALRTGGGQAELAPTLRDLIRTLNPSVPITSVRTMEQIQSESMAETSFTLLILGIASGMALLLGAIGLYGVVSYAVSQRTQEIGVRIALGADRQAVQGLVLRQSVGTTVLGVLGGLLGAFVLTRLMEAVLFQVSSTDLVTFLSVPLVLAGISALATWLPARRAARVDPMQALRAD
jgi:predicted permease